MIKKIINALFILFLHGSSQYLHIKNVPISSHQIKFVLKYSICKVFIFHNYVLDQWFSKLFSRRHTKKLKIFRETLKVLKGEGVMTRVRQSTVINTYLQFANCRLLTVDFYQNAKKRY